MKNLSTVAVCLLTLIMSASVHAQKTAGEHVDDSLLTARVKMALLKNSASDAMDINVETSRSIVQLAGFVSSESTKVTAGKIAAETDDVVGVSNRLRVYTEKRSVGDKLDDTVLTSTIKLKLAEKNSATAAKINVEVRASVVELSGFVNSYEDRDKAVTLVSEIGGVKDVINSIDITR
jgi:hyperosmotically inducible protein